MSGIDGKVLRPGLDLLFGADSPWPETWSGMLHLVASHGIESNRWP